MGKIVFFAIIAVLVWVLFKGLGKKSPTQPSKAVENMVKCQRCGVLMPESDSMMLDGNVSCHDPAHCLHRA